MIVYRDISRSDRIGPPPWLEGCADVVTREDGNGRLHALGDSRLLGPSERGWVALADGWEARVLEPLRTEALARPLPWCPIVHVPDILGRLWAVPAVLTTTGTPQIVAPIGPDWHPRPTETQARALRVAQWFRQAIDAAVPQDPNAQPAAAGIPAAEAARAAAELLSLANGITGEVLLALGLLDERLVLRTGMAAAGIRREGE